MRLAILHFEAVLEGEISSFNASTYATRIAQLLNVTRERVALNVTAASVLVQTRILMPEDADINEAVARLRLAFTNPSTASELLGHRVEHVSAPELAVTITQPMGGEPPLSPTAPAPLAPRPAEPFANVAGISSDSKGGGSLPSWAAVGIVVGVVLMVSLLVCILLTCMYVRARSKVLVASVHPSAERYAAGEEMGSASATGLADGAFHMPSMVSLAAADDSTLAHSGWNVSCETPSCTRALGFEPQRPQRIDSGLAVPDESAVEPSTMGGHSMQEDKGQVEEMLVLDSASAGNNGGVEVDESQLSDEALLECWQAWARGSEMRRRLRALERLVQGQRMRRQLIKAVAAWLERLSIPHLRDDDLSQSGFVHMRLGVHAMGADREIQTKRRAWSVWLGRRDVSSTILLTLLRWHALQLARALRQWSVWQSAERRLQSVLTSAVSDVHSLLQHMKLHRALRMWQSLIAERMQLALTREDATCLLRSRRLRDGMVRWRRASLLASTIAARAHSLARDSSLQLRLRRVWQHWHAEHARQCETMVTIEQVSLWAVARGWTRWRSYFLREERLIRRTLAATSQLLWPRVAICFGRWQGVSYERSHSASRRSTPNHSRQVSPERAEASARQSGQHDHVAAAGAVGTDSQDADAAPPTSESASDSDLDTTFPDALPFALPAFELRGDELVRMGSSPTDSLASQQQQSSPPLHVERVRIKTPEHRSAPSAGPERVAPSRRVRVPPLRPDWPPPLPAYHATRGNVPAVFFPPRLLATAPLPGHTRTAPQRRPDTSAEQGATRRDRTYRTSPSPMALEVSHETSLVQAMTRSSMLRSGNVQGLQSRRAFPPRPDEAAPARE